MSPSDAPHALTGQRVALVIAHPGHELRVHRWIELVRPLTFVFTDGSGRTGQSRLASTSRVLAAAHAQPAAIYGRFTDIELYELVLRADAPALVSVMRELASAFQREGITAVMGDALEGFNPSHDLCRYVINGAALLFQHATGRTLLNYAFPLDGPPHLAEAPGDEHAICASLDASSLARKMASASGYAALRSEVESALARFGSSAFSSEWLYHVLDSHEGLTCMPHEPPQYERFGTERVHDGYYAETIGYRTHVRPLIRAVWRQAGLALAETA